MKKRLIVAAALVLGCGCNSLNLTTPDGSKVTGHIVAWPWQDSSAALQKVFVTHKTNASSISVAGLTQEQVTSTNAVQLIQAITEAAVAGAVKGAK